MEGRNAHILISPTKAASKPEKSEKAEKRRLLRLRNLTGPSVPVPGDGTPRFVLPCLKLYSRMGRPRLGRSVDM